MYVLWVGIRGRGLFVYCIQLGWGCVVSGLVCLTSSGFSSVLFFSVVVFWPQVSIVCLCVCVRGFAHLVYLQERKEHFNKCERM